MSLFQKGGNKNVNFCPITVTKGGWKAAWLPAPKALTHPGPATIYAS